MEERMPFYVLHVDESETCDDIVAISDRIDIHTIIIPPHKPYLFRNAWIGEKFMEHKAHLHGVVVVEQTVDEEHGKISLDIEGARVRAKAAMEIAAKAMIEQYVLSQRDDRMKDGKPPMPPVGRALTLIRGTKTDLGEEYGIYPLGWGKDKAQAAREKETEKLKADNKRMTDIVERQAKMLDLMEKRLGLVEKAVS